MQAIAESLPGAKVPLIGPAAAGKSTLLNKFCSNVFSTPANDGGEMVLDSLVCEPPKYPGEPSELSFWDVGSAKLWGNIRALLDGANIVLICFDVSKRESYEEAINVFYPVAAQQQPPAAFLMLLGLKSDLAINAARRGVAIDEVEEWSSRTGVLYIECSAKDNTNIELITRILKIKADEYVHKPAAAGPFGPGRTPSPRGRERTGTGDSVSSLDPRDTRGLASAGGTDSRRSSHRNSPQAGGDGAAVPGMGGNAAAYNNNGNNNAYNSMGAAGYPYGTAMGPGGQGGAGGMASVGSDGMMGSQAGYGYPPGSMQQPGGYPSGYGQQPSGYGQQPPGGYPGGLATSPGGSAFVPQDVSPGSMRPMTTPRDQQGLSPQQHASMMGMPGMPGQDPSQATPRFNLSPGSSMAAVPGAPGMLPGQSYGGSGTNTLESMRPPPQGLLFPSGVPGAAYSTTAPGAQRRPGGMGSVALGDGVDDDNALQYGAVGFDNAPVAHSLSVSYNEGTPFASTRPLSAAMVFADASQSFAGSVPGLHGAGFATPVTLVTRPPPYAYEFTTEDRDGAPPGELSGVRPAVLDQSTMTKVSTPAGNKFRVNMNRTAEGLNRTGTPVDPSVGVSDLTRSLFARTGRAYPMQVMNDQTTSAHSTAMAKSFTDAPLTSSLLRTSVLSQPTPTNGNGARARPGSPPRESLLGDADNGAPPRVISPRPSLFLHEGNGGGGGDSILEALGGDDLYIDEGKTPSRSPASDASPVNVPAGVIPRKKNSTSSSTPSNPSNEVSPPTRARSSGIIPQRSVRFAGREGGGLAAGAGGDPEVATPFSALMDAYERDLPVSPTRVTSRKERSRQSAEKTLRRAQSEGGLLRGDTSRRLGLSLEEGDSSRSEVSPERLATALSAQRDGQFDDPNDVIRARVEEERRKRVMGGADSKAAAATPVLPGGRPADGAPDTTTATSMTPAGANTPAASGRSPERGAGPRVVFYELDTTSQDFIERMSGELTTAAWPPKNYSPYTYKAGDEHLARPHLVLEIALARDRIRQMVVRDGDNPDTIARAFVQREKLPLGYVPRLSQLIQQKVAQYFREQRAEEKKRKLNESRAGGDESLDDGGSAPVDPSVRSCQLRFNFGLGRTAMLRVSDGDDPVGLAERVVKRWGLREKHVVVIADRIRDAMTTNGLRAARPSPAKDVNAQKLLFELNVQIDENRSGRIRVYDGSVPEQLAARFVATHDLPQTAVAAVARRIRDSIRQHASA